jgi:hypothetical protein
MAAWSTGRGVPAKVATPIAMNPDAEWCLRPLSEPLVAFRGLEAADPNTLGSGAMLYPAPSAGAFVAAIATHSAIVSGVRAKHAREHAEAANKVLEPYQAVLGSFKSQELEDRTLDALTSDGAKSLACSASHTASAWIIDNAPVFFMTQDQTALVLDNVVTVHPPGTPNTTVYRSAVRVVSPHLSADAPAATWLADDGAKLKTESIALFGQSLDIALRVAAGDPVPSDAPFKSFHYYEGASDKVERAQLVSETCGRLLLKTLRATFLSVPTMRTCASDDQMPALGIAPAPK